MIKVILIIMMYSGGTTSVEFDTYYQCEIARDLVIANHKEKLSSSGPVVAFCVNKK